MYTQTIDRDETSSDCEHLHSLCRRVCADGSTQFVGQCVRCGVTTQAIRQDTLSDHEKAQADLVDVDLKERIAQAERQARSAERERLRKADHAEWDAARRAYMRSPEWRALRERIMGRAKRHCEGCLQWPAAVVHHLTYEHLFAEFAWELVALCADCHDRVHQRGHYALSDGTP